MVDLLAEDFLSEESDLVMTKQDKMRAFAWVMLGGKDPESPRIDQRLTAL